MERDIEIDREIYLEKNITKKYLLVGRIVLTERVGLPTGMLQGAGQIHTSL